MNIETEGWFNVPGSESDVVISSRVRLARSLMGHRFPPLLSGDEEIQVRDQIVEAFRKIGGDYRILFLDDVNPVEKRILLERHILSQDFYMAANKAVVLGRDESLHAMINEEDHLRLACIKSGLDLDEAYAAVAEADEKLEEHIPYAASLEWGYLNTSLKNTGTGLRVSAMLHLPALGMDGNIGWALKTASQFDLQIKGFWGEGDNSLANMYQISNHSGMGLSEAEILHNLHALALEMAGYERKARQELTKKRKVELEDRIFRAYGIIKHCRVISAKEAIELLGMVRFGVSLGLLGDTSLETVTALFILTQKSHIQSMLDSLDDESDDKLVDYTRAKLIRRALEGCNV